MIGPHEGKELELMLAGKKKLAAFGDIMPEDGNIHEDITPERRFAPYVANGKIKRLERDLIYDQEGTLFKCVCFTLPNEEWRASTYFWIKQSIYSKSRPYDDATDVVIGRLLGYSEDDIQDFLSK